MYAYAATEAQKVAQDFLTKINEAILFPLITLMMAIALLVFLYGAFEYVKGAANDGDRETGRRHLLYGTIGMLVMLSALAILNIAAATFGLDDELDNATETSSFDGIDYRSPAKNESFDRNIDSVNREPNNAPNNAAQQNTPVVEEEDPSESDPFSEGIDPSFFGFYETKLNEAQQSGTLTIEEIVGFFSLPNGQYPDNYLVYENVELMPFCEARGGVDVFSISINNDTSRQFYCVENH